MPVKMKSVLNESCCGVFDSWLVDEWGVDDFG